MWLPLLALLWPLSAAAQTTTPGAAPAGEPWVFIVGSAAVPAQATEPLAWVEADARAWTAAARAWTSPERVRTLSGQVTAASVLDATRSLKEAMASSPSPQLLVVWLGRGRRAGASMELGLADRWVTADAFGNRLAALGAAQVTLVADVDHAFRWLWPQANGERWVTSETLRPPSLGGRPITAVVETRTRTEQGRLGGSALSVRARSCLLGLADSNGDSAVSSRELTRCVNAMPPTEESLPLAIPGVDAIVAPGGAATAVALSRGDVGQRISLGDGAVLALGRAGAGHGGAWRLPTDVPRIIEELSVEELSVEELSVEELSVEELSVGADGADVTPAERRALSAVSDDVMRGPGLPKDLWGLSAEEEAALDLRLRLAGYFEAEDSGGETTLWLAGGVTAGAIGLGLLVAELALVGTGVFDVTVNGLRPVVLAGGASLLFGVALGVGAVVAPLFSDEPAPGAKPPPGRKRRRAIGAAVAQLNDDFASDGQWRLYGAIAAGGAAAVVGAGAATLTGAVLFGAIGTGDDTRRLLSFAAGGAAGLAVALGAVAVILPLGAGRSSRVLGALELEGPPAAADPTPTAESGSSTRSASAGGGPARSAP